MSEEKEGGEGGVEVLAKPAKPSCYEKSKLTS